MKHGGLPTGWREAGEVAWRTPKIEELRRCARDGGVRRRERMAGPKGSLSTGLEVMLFRTVVRLLVAADCWAACRGRTRLRPPGLCEQLTLMCQQRWAGADCRPGVVGSSSIGAPVSPQSLRGRHRANEKGCRVRSERPDACASRKASGRASARCCRRRAGPRKDPGGR